jgi:biotin-(acetyl-CoA carboxylase) ligase
VIGIGVNAGWQADAFPVELAATMASLGSASGDVPIDRGQLLEAFTSALETRIEALRGGSFDVADWVERQITTGRQIDIVRPDDRVETVLARGVDGVGGGLRIAAPTEADAAAERLVFVGDIRHVRLATV